MTSRQARPAHARLGSALRSPARRRPGDEHETVPRDRSVRQSRLHRGQRAQRRRRTARGCRRSPRFGREAVGETGEVAERGGAPREPASSRVVRRRARDRRVRPRGRRACRSRPATARAEARRTRTSASPPPGAGTAACDRPSPWRTRPPTRERSSERRLVDEMQRRERAPELERPGDRRAEQLGIGPELTPAELREPRRERVVALVRPLADRGSAARLPTCEDTTHRLGEQLQLGCDLEPHDTPSSDSTASVSAPSAGAGPTAADSPTPNTRPSIVTEPSPGWTTSSTRRFARTCASACTPSRASTGPQGTPAAVEALEPLRHRSRPRSAPRSRLSTARLRRQRARRRREGRSGASIVGSSRPKTSRNAPSLRQVETREREVAVGGLVAAVVRVRLESGRDLGRTRRRDRLAWRRPQVQPWPPRRPARRDPGSAPRAPPRAATPRRARRHRSRGRARAPRARRSRAGSRRSGRPSGCRRPAPAPCLPGTRAQ